MNDIGHFRTEIDVSPEYLNHEFFLEVELFFSDLMNLGGTDKWQQYAKEVEDKVEFKSVSSQKYKISKMAQGLFEYVPLIFDEQHFCVS